MRQWCLEKLSSEGGPTLKEGGWRKLRRKYKGPKLSIHSRKGEPSGLEKWREKGSRMWYLEPKREHEAIVTCHLSKSQGICF